MLAPKIQLLTQLKQWETVATSELVVYSCLVTENKQYNKEQEHSPCINECRTNGDYMCKRYLDSYMTRFRRVGGERYQYYDTQTERKVINVPWKI